MISSRPAARDSLLFVYGTLRPFVGVPMGRWLQTVAVYAGPARTAGRLYDLGPYPGMRPARARGELVRGDVYRIANPRVWRTLDRYEASGPAIRARFVRVPCVVAFARGRRRRAWVYAYRGNALRARRIASGDYHRHLALRGRG